MTDEGRETPSFSKSFAELDTKQEAENPRLLWAANRFNPYVEDVFSLGLTILQTIY